MFASSDETIHSFFRATPNKQYLGGPFVDSYLDDTIGSFMGSVTPTRIDGSPSHNARQVVVAVSRTGTPQGGNILY